MEYNLCCVGREAAAAVAETATTSKGQTKVDVEETKHGGRGKKGTRRRWSRAATSFCQKYYGFPARPASNHSPQAIWCQTTWHQECSVIIRGLPYMMTAQMSDYLTPCAHSGIRPRNFRKCILALLAPPRPIIWVWMDKIWCPIMVLSLQLRVDQVSSKSESVWFYPIQMHLHFRQKHYKNTQL